ncbi:MAG: 1,4-dihydroxy-2-naphthoate octaprenyltransferase [Betaproteobacteria bacterium]|nr:1,4-dihydroxy-2-naphthoate octaprenyltransferase [Betaproteobacteria bacterium]
MTPPASAATPPSPLAIEPGSPAAWRIAIRPKTLWIATIPVLVATCLAWSLDGAFSAWIAAVALAAAVLMQVISNLQNDVGYTQRGAETGARIGLPRATAQGWLTPSAVRRAIVVAIVAAQVIALPLMLRGGWPIVLTSVSSTVAAWAYMGGPRPIAYTPFGEFTVFVFFGLVAVVGAYYVQAGTVPAAAWLAAAAIGLHAAAVLLVNNFRDRVHDLATGRRTLAAVVPAPLLLGLYTLLLVAPFALTLTIAAQVSGRWFLLPLLALPRAIGLARALPVAPAGAAQNALLFRTVMLEVAFGLLLSLGALLHRAT